MKFGKERTKYNVNVATHTLRLDFKCVHAEDNWTYRKKCSPASDKIMRNSLQMPTWHSKEGEEPDMVSKHSKSIISLPRNSCEKLLSKEFIHQYMIVPRTMKYFMQASYNITGRKNDANMWITSEQSIFRTKPLQNNWNDTLRCIISGTIRNKWKEDTYRVFRLSRTLSGLCGPKNFIY